MKKKQQGLTLPQEATERTNQGETKNKRKTKNTHRYEQKCQSHTCSGTINSSMYDSDLTITTSPLTSSAPYSGSRPVTSTILQTEILLQFQRQWEDSAILLASNRPHNKDQTKKQRKTEREKNRERLRTGKATKEKQAQKSWSNYTLWPLKH
jgi:hypothetical protein